LIFIVYYWKVKKNNVNLFALCCKSNKIDKYVGLIKRNGKIFMNVKNNRRVKLTKMLLTESFLKLLSQKSLHKISIKEICQVADLNRSTYYSYYSDPYDQLRKIEEEILEDMNVYIDSIEIKIDDILSHQTGILKSILQYIQSKKETFQILLSERGDTKFEQKMLRYFGEKIFNKEYFDEKSVLKKSYHYVYAARGSFAMISRWIMGEDDISLDTMTKWITEVNLPLLKL